MFHSCSRFTGPQAPALLAAAASGGLAGTALPGTKKSGCPLPGCSPSRGFPGLSIPTVSKPIRWVPGPSTHSPGAGSGQVIHAVSGLTAVSCPTWACSARLETGEGDGAQTLKTRSHPGKGLSSAAGQGHLDLETAST